MNAVTKTASPRPLRYLLARAQRPAANPGVVGRHTTPHEVSSEPDHPQSPPVSDRHSDDHHTAKRLRIAAPDAPVTREQPQPEALPAARHTFPSPPSSVAPRAHQPQRPAYVVPSPATRDGAAGVISRAATASGRLSEAAATAGARSERPTAHAGQPMPPVVERSTRKAVPPADTRQTLPGKEVPQPPVIVRELLVHNETQIERHTSQTPRPSRAPDPTPPVSIGEIHVHVENPPASSPDPLALLAPYAKGLTARREVLR